MSIVINMIGGKGGGGSAIPSFDYTGSYRINKSGSKWEIAFLTSGTLTLRGTLNGDIFLQGGGNNGEKYTDQYFGGIGGKGGGRLTQRGISIARGAYTVTVGGSGTASSLGTYTTSGLTNGGAGGARGESSYGDSEWSHRIVNGGSGGQGQLAFGGEDCLIFPGRYFGAGGGGGGANYYGLASPGSGGTTGGGAGGSSGAGSPGTANTGSGGGGGFNQNNGGAGGSGIVLLRGGY